ncbi:ABC transporter permease subunit [Mycoplasmopsis opalescens]|uniref:ABC transporter permease subunit n=1 Tax=Mycoplasmopsis opalescens TaxID=114886 RepID=UPI000A071BEB|nr:ABC transporter permease subunit [Mycoplasmopsis opalescens]
MTTRENNSKNRIKIEKKWHSYRVINNNQANTDWKIKPIFKHLILIAFIILFCFLVYDQASKIRFDNFNLVGENLRKFFTFSNKSTHTTQGDGFTNLFYDSIKALWLTIKLGLVGTFFGFILALLTSILSFSVITNKYSAFIVKITMLILRSIPELVLIGIITKTIRNQLSLLLVYTWFTWLWLHKYYIELLENMDLNPFYTSINQGNSKFSAFNKEIWARSKHRIFALFIFSFESNMRWASILGALSLPGIGVLVDSAGKNIALIEQLGIPLLVLMGFVSLLEISNILLKKFVFEAKTIEIDLNEKNKSQTIAKLTKHINWRKVFYVVMLVFFFTITVITFATSKFSFFETTETKNLLKALVNADFSQFSIISKSESLNPFLMLWQSTKFTIVSLTIAVILTILSIRIQALNLNKTWYAFLNRIINAFIRLIPSIVLFYLFTFILDSSLSLLIIVIGIHQMTSLSKQLTDAIDNLDKSIIENMRMQGYSNNQIFYKYVLPSIKFDFISLAILYFELIFRASITYSIFAEGKLDIGKGIWTNLQDKNPKPELALAYAWIGSFGILAINIFGTLYLKNLKYKIIKKYLASLKSLFHRLFRNKNNKNKKTV